MNKNFVGFKDSNAYKLTDSLSDDIWEIVLGWDWFSRKTIGAQIVTAYDSMPANITEGFGRHHKKDRQKFYYNARGSAYESIHWTDKAAKRKLIAPTQHQDLESRLIVVPREINWLIKFTEEKLKE